MLMLPADDTDINDAEADTTVVNNSNTDDNSLIILMVS